MALPVDTADISEKTSWLDRPVYTGISIRVETILFVAITLLAIFTRFYDLGSRVMSHDENTHVYYSWRLYKGQGFAHDPLMHGPLQFHMIALSYFLFGDNDLTARIPAALFSIATVAFMWFYRRYLGKAGAVIAAILMLISPYILFYGRYVRNEAYVGLFGVITLWAILRYLETGEAKYTYWLTAITVLHFTAKETSFIYTAQALLFLAFYQIYQISKKSWKKPERFAYFMTAFLVGLLLVGIAGSIFLINRPAGEISGTDTAAPSVPGEIPSAMGGTGPSALLITTGLLGIVALIVAVYYLIDGYTWSVLKKDRSFSLLVLLGTLVLPQLSPFLIRLMGWQVPTNASQVNALTTTNIMQMAAILVPIFLISIVIGVIWNPKLWLINAGIWYAIFTVFYTTVFTYGAGFFTGLVGSLGYWLEQQGVNRGSQPWYYYWLVQVPIYEYLPALGSILAVILVALRKGKTQGYPDPGKEEQNGYEKAPVVALLIFWVVTSLVAYSIAGEKMPWLTLHIALPMILLSGWSIGQVIETTDWSVFKNYRGWLTLIILFLFLASLFATLGSVIGVNRPFAGKELEQLKATSNFVLAAIACIASGVGLFFLVKPWPFHQFARIVLLTIFAVLAILTFRTSIQASFINYDNANELLVYAHSAGGVKEALKQIEELSLRTTDGLDMIVGYDSETSYPYYWYLRNYPNARFFGKDPTRSLREASAILVGDVNYSKIEPVVADGYYPFEYIRLWWPNQDYFGLTFERIWNAIKNPEMRDALFKIWLDRDYMAYGQITGRDMSLPNWSPSVRMRLYVRKDVAAQLWEYGISPSAGFEITDPYEGNVLNLSADKIIGKFGTEAGAFQRPRDIAIAPDGSIYVSDTENHRIQHLDMDGNLLHQWGSFGDITTGEAPGSTFNQPWGIAVDAEGFVYVADLWNHRIQKFTAEGDFIRMWGRFGQAESPEAFWGPRDVAVDSQGMVYVTDTGNKRVVVFDQNGNYVSQFGGAGMAPGQFDEPVGVTIDSADNVYVADTWNQRIQVFSKDTGGVYTPILEWEISGWYGQSLDNKPFLDVDSQGMVYVTDPEGQRILVFNSNGEFQSTWGSYGDGPDQFGLTGSVASDMEGGVWVTDTGNNRLMHFSFQQGD